MGEQPHTPRNSRQSIGSTLTFLLFAAPKKEKTQKLTLGEFIGGDSQFSLVPGCLVLARHTGRHPAPSARRRMHGAGRRFASNICTDCVIQATVDPGLTKLRTLMVGRTHSALPSLPSLTCITSFWCVFAVIDWLDLERLTNLKLLKAPSLFPLARLAPPATDPAMVAATIEVIPASAKTSLNRFPTSLPSPFISETFRTTLPRRRSPSSSRAATLSASALSRTASNRGPRASPMLSSVTVRVL